MMATPDDNSVQTGEQRLERRRAALWRFSLIGMAVAAVLGFAGSFGMALVEKGSLPASVVYLTTGVVLAFFLWFTVAYIRRVDELDLLDNLWAGLIGLYFYLVAFPIWNTLASFELSPPVDHWVIYFGTAIVMFLGYGARKLHWR